MAQDKQMMQTANLSISLIYFLTYSHCLSVTTRDNTRQPMQQRDGRKLMILLLPGTFCFYLTSPHFTS